MASPLPPDPAELQAQQLELLQGVIARLQEWDAIIVSQQEGGANALSRETIDLLLEDVRKFLEAARAADRALASDCVEAKSKYDELVADVAALKSTLEQEKSHYGAALAAFVGNTAAYKTISDDNASLRRAAAANETEIKQLREQVEGHAQTLRDREQELRDTYKESVGELKSEIERLKELAANAEKECHRKIKEAKDEGWKDAEAQHAIYRAENRTDREQQLAADQLKIQNQHGEKLKALISALTETEKKMAGHVNVLGSLTTTASGLSTTATKVEETLATTRDVLKDARDQIQTSHANRQNDLVEGQSLLENIAVNLDSNVRKLSIVTKSVEEAEADKEKVTEQVEGLLDAKYQLRKDAAGKQANVDAIKEVKALLEELSKNISKFGGAKTQPDAAKEKE